MFKIDRAANALVPLEHKAFSELGFTERRHLQEWIAKHPAALGEELLVIQKEFSGFAETNERLDLLAVDASGNLVIIENKLDDSGRDVVWQALKYASYCSTLSKENVVSIYQSYLSQNGGGDAAASLCAFLGAEDIEEIEINRGIRQRIILIAANFRREVTSTVLWLARYGLQVQCFSASVYASGDDVLFSLRQLIPTPSAENFMISLSEKERQEASQEARTPERHALRREFWRMLLARMNEKSTLFQGVGGSTKDNWIATGSGGCASYLFRVTRTFGRAELYIYHPHQQQNARRIYDALKGRREEIEACLGRELRWTEIEGRKSYQIILDGAANIFDTERWEEMVERMTDDMLALHQCTQHVLTEVMSR